MSIIREKFDEYVREHISLPNYAEVSILWSDDGYRCDGMVIKMSCDVVEEEDDIVLYYVNGLSDLESLVNEGSAADFVVIPECVRFFDKL